jgi:hypothetical protein
MAGAALFLGVFLLYHFSFSPVPTADGFWYLSNIDRSDHEGILIAHAPLSVYFFFSLKRLLSLLGLSVGTLSLIQTVNAVVAALEAVLFFRVIRLLGGGVLLGILGAALLAASFGSWYFANGEVQHLSLGVLLLIFYLLLRARMTGKPCGTWFVIGLGLLNAVAVLLRQENFLFGFAPVAMLVVGRPWRRGLKDGLLYTGTGILGTAALIWAVGHFLLGKSTPAEIVRWYFWLFEYVGALQEYRSFESASLPLVGMLKGQLTAFVFGTQVVADAVKRPAVLGYVRAGLLAGLTLFAYGVSVLLAANLWRARKPLLDRCLIPLIGCLVWLIAYKVLLHSWFWPTSTKYHIVTLPPLLLLLLLGPIAMRAESGPVPRRSILGPASVAILLVLVFAINFWGGILPWYRYGQTRDALARLQQTTFRQDDFFISAESGIDSVFHKDGNHLGVKGLFKRASKEDGFEAVRSAIEERLKSGQRVFLYNFVPSPFTLIGINQFAQGGDRLSPRDFEEFLADLRIRYVLRPVLSYWEEGKEPLYLYGERLETVWEVERAG